MSKIWKIRLALSLHREAKGLRFAKGRFVVCMSLASGLFKAQKSPWVNENTLIALLRDIVHILRCLRVRGFDSSTKKSRMFPPGWLHIKSLASNNHTFKKKHKNIIFMVKHRITPPSLSIHFHPWEIMSCKYWRKDMNVMSSTAIMDIYTHGT